MSADAQGAAPWTKKAFEAVVNRQVKEIADLRARLAAAEGGEQRLATLLDEVEQREARLCPEGSTYEQHIADLTHQLEDLKPGGTYAWKTRADAAEQALAAVTVERDKWVGEYNTMVQWCAMEMDAKVAAEQQLAEVRGALEWQPIETAATSGTDDVMVYCEDTGEQFVAYPVGGGAWCFATTRAGQQIACKPTHWKPLPAPPPRRTEDR